MEHSIRNYQSYVGVTLCSAGLALALALGCSSNNSSAGPGTSDAGEESDASTLPDSAAGDAGTQDAATDSARDGASDASTDAEAGTRCLTLGTPTQMAPDDNVMIVSSDGYVFSQQAQPAGVNATPLDGGATVTTGITASNWALVGPVYMGITSVAGSVQLTSTWAAGVKGSGTPISFEQAAVSSDGQYLVVDGSDGTVVFSKTDMTGQVTLVTPPDGGQACQAIVGFAGTSYVVVSSFCQTPFDGGATPLPATITSYALPSLTPTTILTNAQWAWSADAAGTSVFAITTSGVASVFPLAGGAGTVIDTNVWSGFLSPDGMSVVYATTSGQLKRSATSNPQPAVLVSSGVYDFPAALSAWNALSTWPPAQSPGGTEIFTCGSEYCLTGDLSFASATSAGSRTPVIASGGYPMQDLFYDAFTRDGTYALVRTLKAGFFGASPLVVARAGAAPKTLATASSAHFAAASGAKVVFDDNYNASNGTSDLYVVDLASACATPTLVTSAISGFGLNPAHDTIVYGKGRVYTLPIP